MKLPIRSVTDFARSPRGKQLLQRAKAMDTPENRAKAMQLAKRLRGSKPPAR